MTTLNKRGQYVLIWFPLSLVLAAMVVAAFVIGQKREARWIEQNCVLQGDVYVCPSDE